MENARELKTAGLRFARALQGAVRTAFLFPTEHSAAKGPISQSFDSLQDLIREHGDFTIGFIDHQVLLNKLLTSDSSLAPLEKEFVRRGICAITFEAGVDLPHYRQLISLLVTPMKTVEALGIHAFLERNVIANVKILPILNNQYRTKDGDLLLEGDSTSYLMARQAGRSRQFNESMEALLQSAAMEKSGIEVIVAGLAGMEEGEGGGTTNETTAMTPGGSGGRDTLMEILDSAVMKALTDPNAQPEKSYLALAHLLQQVRVDSVLARFPPEQQQKLRSQSSEQVAGEFIDETALQWARRRIADATSEDREQAEQEVALVLMRAIQATRAADRLAGKLDKLIQEHALPSLLQDRVRTELQWTVLPPIEKQRRLMSVARFDNTQFRRMMDLLREFVRRRELAPANELARRYMKVLELPAAEIPLEEISRLPELIQVMSADNESFLPWTLRALKQGFERPDLPEPFHLELVKALGELARPFAAIQDFSQVGVIAGLLDGVWQSGRVAHARCCGQALQGLLSTAQFGALIDLYLARRDDTGMARAATILLRSSGPAVVDQLFTRLENEQDAKTRIALKRLLGLTGAAGIEVARQKLADERWYVVRNACLILGELRDPELPEHFSAQLRHEDERVQQAAAAVVIKSRVEGGTEVLAQNLPHLRPSVLEVVLDELMFRRDPTAAPALQALIRQTQNREIARKAIQALVALGGNATGEMLGQIVADDNLDLAVRRFALASLGPKPDKMARASMAKVVARGVADPLAPDCERSLEPL